MIQITAYATEAELEGILLVSTTFFGAATPITTTMVAVILDEYSVMLDGLCGVSEGNFGTTTTAPKWVNSAVLLTAAAKIEAKLNDTIFTTVDAMNLMKSLIAKHDITLTPQFKRHMPATVGHRYGTWTDEPSS